MKNIGVIICAAGKGTRFGGKEKKPFVEVDGRPALLRSIDFFARRDDVKQILVAVSPEDEERLKLRYEASLAFMGARLCTGGTERFDTVKKALALIKGASSPAPAGRGRGRLGPPR